MRYFLHHLERIVKSQNHRRIAESRLTCHIRSPVRCASVRVPFNILELTTPLIVAVSREQAADKTHRWSVKFHARGLLPFLSSSSFARQPSPRTFHTEPETRADTRKREKEMDSGVEREEGAFVAHAHGFPLLVDIGAPSPSPPLPRPFPPPPVRPSPPPRSQRRTAPPTTPPTVSRLSPLPPRRSPPRPSPPVRVPRFYPHSTPPALPRPVRVAVTPPFARRVLRHGHSLSPLASCLSSHVSISSTPATLPRRPVRPFLFFLFSFFSSLPLLCLLAPIFPPLFPPRVLPLLSHLPLPSTHATIYFHRPRLYPSIVVSFPLPTLRVPFFISFFLSFFFPLLCICTYIFYIYVYTYIRIVSRFTGRRAYIEWAGACVRAHIARAVARMCTIKHCSWFSQILARYTGL